MNLENIATVRGNLLQCVAQLDPKTILHADETQKLRWTNEELRNLGSWTADFAQFTIENDGTLYLARRDNNLILENLDEAFSQLVNKGYYRPLKDDAERVKSSESTLAIILSKLSLKGNKKDDYLYIEIDTLNYKKTINEEQNKIAERAHGSMAEYLDEKTNNMTSDFAKSMEMLYSAGKNTTRIYVPNPKYVKSNAQDGAIVRVCWLSYFDSNSNFCANSWYVDGVYGALRGVRRQKVVAEGDSQKIDESLLQIKPALEKGSAFEYNGRLYV
ncbi:MAG: hypothetical protein Q8O89_06445, partial [Nanoarchaeota archaeon]|nr:hypothetical protein [Nanoarchaeota archaeon]